MNSGIYRILIAGEGGQGVQTMAHVLARAANIEGLNIAFLPNYGVEQRGGVSLAFIQLGNGVIGFPKFQTADIIVNMRTRAVERIAGYVGEKTLYIYDNDLIQTRDLAEVHAEKLPIPATSTAARKLEPKVFNMILLGALVSEISGISMKAVEQALDEELGDKYSKKPQLKHLNRKALEMGAKLAKESYK